MNRSRDERRFRSLGSTTRDREKCQRVYALTAPECQGGTDYEVINFLVGSLAYPSKDGSKNPANFVQ